MGKRRKLKIGICGTFDLQAYGDLLFPIIAEAELKRRLGEVKLYRFSYLTKAPPTWPFRVIAVAELPTIAPSLDGMLIGGGHIIRFDKAVAPGYHPPTLDVHHPAGYWLVPALIALGNGCPVAWNAPGAYGAIPEWASPLLETALQLSAYIAVRDQAARDALAQFAGERDIAVVPDTAFGLARLVDPNSCLARFFEA